MTKKVTSVPVDSDPTSLKDAAYRFAMSGENAERQARYVLEQCPGFLDDIPKEIKTELFAGFQMRKHELTGDKYYKMGDGGNYIPLAEKPGDDMQGVVCMTINAAMSYSPQEFGKMREADPAKHGIVKPLRDAFSTYASNSLKDLRTKIRRILTANQPRERAANKGFIEAANTLFDTLEKRVKVAADRGDPDADIARFRVARNAFWNGYNA